LEEKKLLRFVIFSFIFNNLIACSGCPQHKSCPVSSSEESRQVVETMQKDKGFQSFLAEALQQKEAVLKDPEFQDFVADLQAQAQTSTLANSISTEKQRRRALYLRFFLTGR
jgi:hypothetical protein